MEERIVYRTVLQYCTVVVPVEANDDVTIEHAIDAGRWVHDEATEYYVS